MYQDPAKPKSAMVWIARIKSEIPAACSNPNVGVKANIRTASRTPTPAGEKITSKPIAYATANELIEYAKVKFEL